MDLKFERNETIGVALERISQVFRSMLWELSKIHGLSPIQIQFLLFIDAQSQKNRIVSEIANRFSLSAATVSDAIKSLEKKKLVKKRSYLEDRRMVLISPTEKGKEITGALIGWKNKLIKNFPEKQKDQVLYFLVELIEYLQQENLLLQVDTCLSCLYFTDYTEKDKFSPWCLKRDKSLSDSGLRIDCFNYVKKNVNQKNG
jgi:DNA-binding MarR family transcriptional regulator